MVDMKVDLLGSLAKCVGVLSESLGGTKRARRARHRVHWH
jgi:hypothetical protein